MTQRRLCGGGGIIKLYGGLNMYVVLAILAGTLAVLGFTVPLFYGIMILTGFISLELMTDDESFTAIYLNTKQEEE